MKRMLRIIGALLMLMLFCACSPSKLSEEEVREFYMEYVEAHAQDKMAATLKYVHFEYESMLEAEKANEYNKQTRTEILDIEQLSSDLWLVQIYYESTITPSGGTAYHFVGMIDGKCKVMKGHLNVPTNLAKNLDLEKYAPDNYVHPDDVLPEDIEIN